MTAGMVWVETTTDKEARALDRRMWDFATRVSKPSWEDRCEGCEARLVDPPLMN